jgi:long-chain acyl-CoA synthetase
MFRPSLTYPQIPYGEMLTRPVTLYPNREAIVWKDVMVNAFASGLRSLGVQHDLLSIVSAVRGDVPRLKHVITVGADTRAAETIRFAYLVASSPATPPSVANVGRADVLALPYSSGTTGLPKGVLLSHQGFVCNNIQFNAGSRMTDADRLLLFLPLYHIYGLMLMGGAVHAGARLVLMDRFDLAECLRLVTLHRITFLPVVPPVLAGFVTLPEAAKMDWSSVRALMIGAAPVPPALARRFMQMTGVRVVQGYGLTESGPVTHLNPFDDDERLTLDTAGLPCHDTEHKVVDLETGERELPIGEIGEVCVRGPQLMLGYWNAPEATAAALRGGWLYTGDVGRIDERGYLTITDRKKEMASRRPRSRRPLRASRRRRCRRHRQARLRGGRSAEGVRRA